MKKKTFIGKLVRYERRNNSYYGNPKYFGVFEDAEGNIFSSGFQDYVTFLPDYTTPSLNLAKYRVIAVVHHTKDYNNYLTYSTTEVNR